MEKSQQPQNSPVSSVPIFNISQVGFQELLKASLTLDQLFYLECVKHKVDLKEVVTRDRLLSWKQSLIRKGFLTEDGEVSVLGAALLEAVGSGNPFKGALEEKIVVNEKDFEAWWAAFPSSDIFEYKGRKFSGSRSLKYAKKDCKVVFDKIINEGGTTGADLIRCIEYEVLMKKEESVKNNENKMKFMKSAMSYLNSRQYEGFLETSKNPISIQQSFEDI